MKTIVCIGDSIVEGEGDELGLDGWVGRLRNKVGKPWNENGTGCRVFNLGIGGNTIRDVHYRLGEALLRSPDIIILGCGGNDIKKYLQPDGSSEQCLAMYQVEKNWREVLDKLKALCPKVLVLGGHTVPPAGATDEVVIRHADKANLMKFVKELCVERGLGFMEPVEYTDFEKHFSHGSHPSAAGYELYATHVYDKLNSLKWI